MMEPSGERPHEPVEPSGERPHEPVDPTGERPLEPMESKKRKRDTATPDFRSKQE